MFDIHVPAQYYGNWATRIVWNAPNQDVALKSCALGMGPGNALPNCYTFDCLAVRNSATQKQDCASWTWAPSAVNSYQGVDFMQCTIDWGNCADATSNGMPGMVCPLLQWCSMRPLKTVTCFPAHATVSGCGSCVLGSLPG